VSDASPEQRLTVEESTGDGQVVLTLSGELDPHTAPTLQSALDRTMSAGTPSSLLLDLTGLKFIDSSGLRVLIDAHRTLSEDGNELVVRNPSSTARRLFEITKLDDHFRIEQTDPTA
jgi:anti-sigma B factor antagonist